MSSSDRLSWLAREVWNGRSASVSFSFNVNNGREKVKFILDDVYVQSVVYRPALLSAISAVQIAMESSIVTDKGHKSKSHRQTVIEFWIEQLPACSANTLSLPSSNPEPLPLDAANSAPRNYDYSATAMPSHAEVPTTIDHQDHATDLARDAELEMQLAACDVKVSTCDDGEDLSGVGVRKKDPGPIHGMNNSVDGTGSFCQSYDDKEDLGNLPKRARFLVEM